MPKDSSNRPMWFPDDLITAIGRQAFAIDAKSQGKEGGRIVRKLIADFVESKVQRAISQDPQTYRTCGTVEIGYAPAVGTGDAGLSGDGISVRFHGSRPNPTVTAPALTRAMVNLMGTHLMQSNQSGIDHYVSADPRRLYTGQCAESSPLPFASVPLLDAVDAGLERLRTQRVALIFDNVVRPDTTGIYCLRALRSIAQVTHVQPSELAALNRGDFDLYLYIDDGLKYPLRPDLHPSALWAIDTHLMPERLLRRAAAADYVFAAQRDGAVLLREHGINCVAWMPLACDPDIHCCHAVPKELDVCFVGHLSTPGRQELAALIRQKFSNSFVGQRFFAEMAQTYSSSRIVLNLSIRNDINMRVFEALACGSLLITNDLRSNGLGELFDIHNHLAVYHDIQELVALIQRYVSNEPLREQIAAAGRKEALAYHTYAHRMRAVLSQVARGAGVHFDRKSATGSTENIPQYDHAEYRMTSIIILTRDQLVFSRQCLDSIRRHVRVPCEIIVVDNGSTDGTVEYLCAADDVHLIANPDNVGFAAGVNQGIAASKGDQILLLNNDAVLTPSCVERMLRTLSADHTIGIVGPCSNNVPGPQKIVTDYDFSALDAFANDVAAACDSQIQDVSVLVGFCMLMRREVVIVNIFCRLRCHWFRMFSAARRHISTMAGWSSVRKTTNLFTRAINSGENTGRLDFVWRMRDSKSLTEDAISSAFLPLLHMSAICRWPTLVVKIKMARWA